MEVIKYQVRAIVDGEVVYKDEFKRKLVAVDKVEKLVDKAAAVTIRQVVRAAPDKFKIEDNSVWGIKPHDTWSLGTAPLSTIFLHTSVTPQLDVSASRKEERAQMRYVDDIARGRGFNGFSYSFGVFPSGRAYEGRGYLVSEAATEGYNTSSDSICTIGNTDVFDPTEAQIEAIIAIIKRGQKQGHYAAKLEIRGHREVAAKACPGAKFTDELINYVQRQVNK